ncbi:pyridoxine 5'-phosphate synthase [Candidatus Aerophobetes bacterium Ae_b3a]|nr:MAG: pyridoxine 5'-phosphate synthase [Candidatus Aerophobetes bacterium Ae_b3a]
MARLSVNIDHIATLRQARRVKEPEPIAAALLAELAGAEGITVHLRKDRRHIQERDLEILRATIKTKLNLEMGTNEEIVKIALRVRPDLATLVPEKEEEITTEGGLDFSRNDSRLKEVISLLHDRKIMVSLFIDPTSSNIKKAHRYNSDTVEIHTGHYAETKNELEIATELEKIAGAAALARKLGLGVNAGHGLDYQNVKKVCLIEEIQEFSIGHSIIARACLVGIKEAVAEMLKLIGG